MNRTAYQAAASAYRRGQRVRFQSKSPWSTTVNPYEREACAAVREAFHRDGSLSPIPRGYCRAPKPRLGETIPFVLARVRDARHAVAGAARMYRKAERNHAANVEKLKDFPSIVYRGKNLIEHAVLVLAGIARTTEQYRTEHANYVHDLYAPTDGWKRYRRAERVITLRCRHHAAQAWFDALPLAA